MPILLTSTYIYRMSSFNGHCYCGKIQYMVDEDVVPNKSVYCHCDSCRRSHSAPLYHVVYIPKESFHIVEGMDHLTSFSKEVGGVTRSFCRICGSKICNELPLKPELGVGFFPNTLNEDIQKDLPEKFKPIAHYHHVEAVLPINNWNDGLART